MKRPQLRVGILGAGPIAQAAHLEAVQKAGNCELHALCDRAPDLLETVGATWRPARTFGDLGAMLADPDVDAVIVAIADQFHVDAAMQALDAGKHVLVEKPMADLRRYNMLGHGSHLVDTARFLAGEITAVHARLVERAGIQSWFVACEFADGSNGHLDLTIAVRMDWHEGFQAYGEHGSVLGRTFLPWSMRTSEVEAFSTRTGGYHRPLGPDGHFWRRQAEGFAATILEGAPQQGATAEDGLAALQVMEAIETSVDTGERVALAPLAAG